MKKKKKKKKRKKRKKGKKVKKEKGKKEKGKKEKKITISLLNMESPTYSPSLGLVDSSSPSSSSSSTFTVSSSSSSSSITSFLSSWKTWAVIFVVVAFLGFNVFLFLGKESNYVIDRVKGLFYTTTNKLFHSHTIKSYEKPTHLNNVSEVHAPPDMSTEELQPPSQSAPSPDEADSLIQTQGKAGWCFVGEDRGFRSCVQVGENDTCLSGDIFPTKDKCVNPKLRY